MPVDAVDMHDYYFRSLIRSSSIWNHPSIHPSIYSSYHPYIFIDVDDLFSHCTGGYKSRATEENSSVLAIYLTDIGVSVKRSFAQQ